MSQLSELLLKAAEEIRLSSPTESAVELLKQAGFPEDEARYQVAQHLMEKEAISTLTQAGVDVEQAVSMVKAAKVNLKELTTIEQEPEHCSVDLLKKASVYIETLENEIAELNENLEKAASMAAHQEVILPEQIVKAAGSGAFTFEDLEEMKKMDQAVLTKVASVFEEPWGMGQGAGMARPKTDPLLEFILG